MTSVIKEPKPYNRNQSEKDNKCYTGGYSDVEYNKWVDVIQFAITKKSVALFSIVHSIEK